MKSIDRLISVLPDDAEYAIAIVPSTDDEHRLIYIGLSPEQVAHALYKCADEIIRQKVPLPTNKSLN